MDISNKIAMGLKLKGLSQRELAEMLGIHQTGVGKWISGKSLPTADKLIEIIKILDLVEDFFPGYGKLDDTELDSVEKKLALLDERVKILEKADSSGKDLS